VCYSIQYERVTAKVYIKHIFFTVKPTLLNINILHPKVSAVPSAQASPGPHARSILHPVCARPGPQISVSTLHTNLFYISFVSDLPLFLWFVCMYVFVCFLFFCHPVPQKSSCEVQAFESLFFYQLANRKRDQQIYIKCPFCSFLLNSLFFFFVKFTDGAPLLDPPEETHRKDHSKELDGQHHNGQRSSHIDVQFKVINYCRVTALVIAEHHTA